MKSLHCLDLVGHDVLIPDSLREGVGSCLLSVQRLTLGDKCSSGNESPSLSKAGSAFSKRVL